MNNLENSIDEAIHFAMCFGPAKTFKERCYWRIRHFLAREFSRLEAAMIASDPELAKLFKPLFHELYTQLIRRPNDGATRDQSLS